MIILLDLNYINIYWNGGIIWYIITHKNENKVHSTDSDIHTRNFNTEEYIKTIFVQTIINDIYLLEHQNIICTGREQKIKVVD